MAQNPSSADILALKGKSVHVTELLALFGMRIRDGQAVLLIEQALKAAGLTAVPSFATCGHGTPLHIQLAQEADAPADPDPEADEEELPTGALPQHALRVGDILMDKSGFTSLGPTAQLIQATHLMRWHGYSQLPIVESNNTLHGVITWSSVAKLYETNLKPTLANAMETVVPVVEEHHEFFAILPRLSESGYVLVRGNDGVFKGIVTSSDITERFSVTARPFFMVGEIEFRIRKCLGRAIHPDAIRAVQPKKRQTGQISDLMFGDYVRLLDGQQREESLRPKADQNWQDLGWGGVDRVGFVHQLDRVRDIRNRIAHFDPQPLPDSMTEELRKFVQMLRQYVPDH
ncbi:HPP family protein [Streptomyces sp. NPDC048257]|uniref:CBS domain-containing protein n=1 Tax=Streptomyces sp. NPDC048257 TaxID=3365526 RepID=UPI003717A21D